MHRSKVAQHGEHQRKLDDGQIGRQYLAEESDNGGAINSLEMVMTYHTGG